MSALLFRAGSTYATRNTVSRNFFTSKNDVFDKLYGVGKSDQYKNFNLDLVANSDSSFKSCDFKKALSKVCTIVKNEGMHLVALKVPSTWGREMKYAIDLGFRHHNANPEFSQLNKCLKNHTIEKCTYPKFRTVSVGASMIVFNKGLDKVLLVMEKHGGIKKFKPPTGTVEYGGKEQETPIQGAARELYEETGLIVDPKDGIFVGTTWSNNFRGINPDISYVFTFVLENEIKPLPQEEEIEKCEWINVADFLKTLPEENEKPWIHRQTVKTALNALRKGKFWEPKTFYWNNGKPVDLFRDLHQEE